MSKSSSHFNPPPPHALQPLPPSPQHAPHSIVRLSNAGIQSIGDRRHHRPILLPTSATPALLPAADVLVHSMLHKAMSANRSELKGQAGPAAACLPHPLAPLMSSAVAGDGERGALLAPGSPQQRPRHTCTPARLEWRMGGEVTLSLAPEVHTTEGMQEKNVPAMVRFDLERMPRGAVIW